MDGIVRAASLEAPATPGGHGVEVTGVLGIRPDLVEQASDATTGSRPAVAYDPSRGLAGLAPWVRRHRVAVLHVPALLGRWVPASDPAEWIDGCPRIVVVHGPTIDPAAAAGLRAAFGPGVEMVATATPEAAERAVPATSSTTTEGTRALGSRPPGLGPLVAPIDEVEAGLVDILETVTGTAPLGTSDPLRALGVVPGSAAWLVDEIRCRYGIALRAIELLRLPTAAALATVIREDGGSTARRPVAAVLHAGAGPTVLLLHDRRGAALPMLGLAAELGCSVVGFESPLLSGDPPPFADLSLMALRYASELPELGLAPPYRLAGWGFGGVLAFEVARQLVASGEEVATLAVVDAGPAARLPHALGQRRLPRPHELRSRGARPRGRVPLVDRPEFARVEHDRLLRRYRWPRCQLDLRLSLAWSTDVGADDSSMGWGTIVGDDRLDVVRLRTPFQPEPDDERLTAWAQVLRRVVSAP